MIQNQNNKVGLRVGLTSNIEYWYFAARNIFYFLLMLPQKMISFNKWRNRQPFLRSFNKY